MKYGKRITESWFNGSKTSERVEEITNIAIVGKDHLLQEVLSGMELVIAETVDELTMCIKRNKDGKLLLVKTHQVK